MLGSINKKTLLEQVKRQLQDDLATVMASAEAAAEGATSSESKPENKYDTRGLEASYLAGAQNARVEQLQGAIRRLDQMMIRDFGESDGVAIGALVEITQGPQKLLCLVLPVGAGIQLKYDEKTVTTVTTQSPLGQALLGKFLGDEVEWNGKIYELTQLV